MDSFTHFFHFDTTEKIIEVDENYRLGINPQIPSLDPPLMIQPLISENNCKVTSRFLPSPRFINKQTTQRILLHTTNGFYKMLFIGTCNFRTLLFDLKKNCIACLFKNRKVKIPFISSVLFSRIASFLCLVGLSPKCRARLVTSVRTARDLQLAVLGAL